MLATCARACHLCSCLPLVLVLAACARACYLWLCLLLVLVLATCTRACYLCSCLLLVLVLATRARACYLCLCSCSCPCLCPQYKTAAFGHEVLRLIGELRVPGWTHVTAPYAHAHAKSLSLPGHTAALPTHTQPAQTQSLPAHAAHTAPPHTGHTPSTTLPGETGPLPAAAGLQIEKVSGSLTNAVFFISWRGGGRTVPTVLLRIYGPSSSTLISRRRELSTLHVLSTVYGIGPRIYGTFVNGRVEEYFESAALTSASVRGGEVSRWVGRRMAELHCVDLGVVWGAGDDGVLESVRRNVGSWLGPAREVLALARGRDGRADGLDLTRFEEEWGRYWEWLEEWEAAHGRSERVFAHNDTQYGNLLRLTGRAEAGHETIIVVDFEYAGPNALAYDIANHFHEWMADYHGARPHELRAGRYPTAGERRNFYRAYMGERARRGQGVFEGTGAGGAGYPSEAVASI
ncbi:kinase-like domain-containing protein [Gautieria morchelliformis]|nr:kinase-like domain-containing protein [Gautieria morchelliformis]